MDNMLWVIQHEHLADRVLMWIESNAEVNRGVRKFTSIKFNSFFFGAFCSLFCLYVVYIVDNFVLHFSQFTVCALTI